MEGQNKKIYTYKKKNNGKNDTGRPSKYKPEYCKMIVDYFDVQAYTEKQTMTSFNDKTWSEKEYTKPRPVDFPTFEWFASTIDVDDSTLENRTKEYNKFFLAYRKARQLQKRILIVNWLNWLYKEWYAKFVAINCFPEMKDKTESNTNISWEINQILDINQAKRIAERLLSKKDNNDK